MPNQSTYEGWPKELVAETRKVKRLTYLEKIEPLRRPCFKPDGEEQLQKVVPDLTLEKLILRNGPRETPEPTAVLVSVTSGRSSASRSRICTVCLTLDVTSTARHEAQGAARARRRGRAKHRHHRARHAIRPLGLLSHHGASWWGRGLLRQSTRTSPLKVEGTARANRRGPAKALVAGARRLAAILHRMWTDNTVHRWQPQSA